MFDQVGAVALHLVTNAVQTTGIMDEHLNLTHVDYLNTIMVRLLRAEDVVVVEVWDSSQAPPIGPAPAGHRSEVYFPTYGGKVVWTAVQYPLPRRRPAAFSYPHEPVDQRSQYTNDLTTIWRVRVGLEKFPATPNAGKPRRVGDSVFAPPRGPIWLMAAGNGITTSEQRWEHPQWC